MKNRSKIVITTASVALVVGVLFILRTASAEDHPVSFTGGHETDRQDGGRPCVLIAAALSVKTEVFREAFSGVTPAKDGRPTGEEARRNKKALLKILGPHGVTNERLDEVSDYYRYRPQGGGLWNHKSAHAHAIVEDGKVVRIVVTEPGSGYSTPPKVTIRGMDDVELVVTLLFDKDLAKNGSIQSIEVKK